MVANLCSLKLNATQLSLVVSVSVYLINCIHKCLYYHSGLLNICFDECSVSSEVVAGGF